MPYILHYNAEDDLSSREYIVITDGDNTEETREEHCINGYVFYAAYEIEETGTLPTERALIAK